MAIAQGSEGAGGTPVAATRDVEFALDRFDHEAGRLVVEAAGTAWPAAASCARSSR